MKMKISVRCKCTTNRLANLKCRIIPKVGKMFHEKDQLEEELAQQFWEIIWGKILREVEDLQTPPPRNSTLAPHENVHICKSEKLKTTQIPSTEKAKQIVLYEKEEILPSKNE